jgi:hypothetical protein
VRRDKMVRTEGGRYEIDNIYIIRLSMHYLTCKNSSSIVLYPIISFTSDVTSVGDAGSGEK